eukprot:359936-Chlamydomonas_euryale.AAC.3
MCACIIRLGRRYAPEIKKAPLLSALVDAVAQRPNIKAYLASDRVSAVPPFGLAPHQQRSPGAAMWSAPHRGMNIHIV